MKPLHILLLLCLCLGGYGQSVWNKTYIEDRPVMLFSSVIADSGFYYVSGVTIDKNTSQQLARVFIGKIDGLGNMVNYKSIYDSIPQQSGTYWNSLVKNDKGQFVVSGFLRDSTYRLLLTSFNHELDSVKLYQYSNPNTYTYDGLNMLQYDNNSYFITGIKIDSFPNDANTLLVKIDSNHNRVFEKRYGVIGTYEYGKSILKLNNGNILIGSFRTDQNQIQEHSNTWLLEVDTAGNLVRQWYDPNDSTHAAEGLKKTQDGGFIYGAMKKIEDIGGLITTTATIVKMDSLFHKEWTYIGGDESVYTSLTDIEELSDGGFIACGNEPYSTNVLGGWIVKLDAQGNVLWQRNYIGTSASPSLNFFSDIDVLLDGSLIAVGQCQNLGQNPPQVGWFLKLDSNGCEIENCVVGIDEPQAQQLETFPLHLYPNPATTEITITADETMLGSALTITDITGRQVLAATLSTVNSTFSIQHFAAGIYHVLVKRGAQTIAVNKFVKE